MPKEYTDNEALNPGMRQLIHNTAGELKMADYICSLELSAIVINMELQKYDVEEFAQKHYAFYTCIRQHQPDFDRFVDLAQFHIYKHVHYHSFCKILKILCKKDVMHFENLYDIMYVA